MTIKETIKKMDKKSLADVVLSLLDNNIITENDVSNAINTTMKDDNCSLDTIFNYYNSLGIKKHRAITAEIKSAIGKALKIYTCEQICEYMRRYSIVLNDTKYFFSYRWGLADFLNRKEGISSFSDDGGKWTNYIDSRPLIDTTRFFQSLWDIYSEHNDNACESAKIEFDKKFLYFTEEEKVVEKANDIYRKMIKYLDSVNDEYVMRFDNWLKSNIENSQKTNTIREIIS